MIRKRWIICVAIALALILALLAALLLTSKYNKPPLSDGARFVCARLISE